MSVSTTSVSTVPGSARPRRRTAVLVGSLAFVILAGAGIGGGYWWHEHNLPSQASKADCALAQQIIDGAQKLPAGDKKAIDQWAQDTAKTRRAQMKDGYLGYNIAQYEGWVTTKAKGEAGELTQKQMVHIADQANSHCTDAKVTLAFPSLNS
ncbi:hypothetical protein ACQEWB_25610 [Streptomyces sp. CA-249302]|uniref:hypothetical protein n=1 Tax=Streptomyces sp. CA-249302 TaxID=3240058 RepID=UPI003D902506